jgi:hypothetical protein
MNWKNIHLDHKPVNAFNLDVENEWIVVIIQIFNHY